MQEKVYEIVIDAPPNPTVEEWSKKDSKARVIIHLSIEDSQIIYVKILENAHDTWNALREAPYQVNCTFYVNYMVQNYRKVEICNSI